MNVKIQNHLIKGKHRIEQRLDKTRFDDNCPVHLGTNIHYELSEKTHAISVGGIGMIHEMVTRLGLDRAINRSVPVLKRYLPYADRTTY